MISVILSTYNAPAALRASLRSFVPQTDRDFEIVVADDGSTGETADMLASFEAEGPFALHHVRQEDAGFRLARVRNLAIGRSRGD